MIELAELSALPPLKGLSPQALAHLAGAFTRRAYADREVVFHEGGEGTELFLLGSGTVKISKRSREGEAQSLAVHQAGEFLGIMTFLEGGRHSANATASGPTVLFVMDRAAFDAFVAGFPADGVKLLRLFLDELVESLRRMNERYIDMVNYMWRWR